MAGFALIAHPPAPQAFRQRLPLGGMWLPLWATEPLLRMSPPRILGHLSGIESISGASAEGVIIECSATERQLLQFSPLLTRQKLRDSIALAGKAGACVAGVGRVDYFLERRGQSPVDVPGVVLTSGLGLSLASRLRAVELVSFQLGIDLADIKIAIVGASHPVGAISARLLAQRVHYLSISEDVAMPERRRAGLGALAARILHESGLAVTIADWPQAIGDAGIVVLAGDSSGPEMIRLAQELNPGCVLFDFRRQSLSRQSMIYGRNGECKGEPEHVFMVIEPLLGVPGKVESLPSGILTGGLVHPWMAEAMILSLEGMDFTAGQPGRWLSISWIETVQRLAEKHGFSLEAVECNQGVIHIREISALPRLVRGTGN